MSSFWRFHLNELKEAFPNAHYRHLVRNGRQVVLSTYCRSKNLGDMDLPKYFCRQLTVEQQHCWHWRFWNEEISKFKFKLVRLEDLFLEVHANRGPQDKPWTPEWEAAFSEICGPLNRKYGYE